MNVFNIAPPEAWLLLFGVIIGSVFTLLGVWLTNRANLRSLEMQLEHHRAEKEKGKTRERLEKLYVECRKYFSDVCTYYLPYRRVMQGEMTYNQALDMTIKHGSAKDYEPNHVPMLIDFYFPEFKDDFHTIMRTRDHLNEIMAGFREQYRNGNTDGSRWLELFQPVYESLAKKMEAFEDRIACYSPSD